MTIYFYDDKELSLIAVDTTTKTARILQQSVLGQEAPAPTDEPPHEIALPQPSSFTTKPKQSTRKPGQPCSECRSKGKRHKNGCSLAGSSKHQAQGTERNDAWKKLSDAAKLSRSTFDRIKLSQSLDIPSDVIARELKLSLEQVNAVMRVRDFDDL